MNRLFIFLLVVVGVFAYLLYSPSIVWLEEEKNWPDANTSTITATFFGTSTLLFSDGETDILIDGFFSRPGFFDLAFNKIEPDTELIDGVLSNAGIDQLAAVVVVHSHYDHAMDAPEVAKQTNAILVGSESTANIGRGWGLSESQILVPDNEQPISFGDFTIRLIPSRHVPRVDRLGIDGELEQPLVPPVRFTDYKEGVSYSIFLEHPQINILIQASAGYVPGALDPYQADVVFLGVAGLSKQSEQYGQLYFDEVVKATEAKIIVPIHWDNFTLSLERPLKALPRLVDDIALTLDQLRQQAAYMGVTIKHIKLFDTVTLPR